MALCCGCEMVGGGPVSLETIKAHYRHTFEVLLFWELIHRQGSSTPNEDKLKLSQARIDFLEAIDELYPEARQE